MSKVQSLKVVPFGTFNPFVCLNPPPFPRCPWFWPPRLPVRRDKLSRPDASVCLTGMPSGTHPPLTAPDLPRCE